MMKVAVIFESSPFDRKGLFNAVHNRILNLRAAGECQVDAFCVHSWDSAFTRRVRHTPVVSERVESVDIDGITYKMLWYGFSLADYAFVEKLHVHPFFFGRLIRRWLPLFRDYDRISAHSFTGGLIASAASEAYGIPYCVTWHGSDVHTHPWRNPLILKETAAVMSGASCNFFVSRALMDASERIVPSGEVSGSVSASTAAGVSGSGNYPDSGLDRSMGRCRKMVLYNGVSEEFVRFPDHCREEVRRNNGLAEGDKVVAFVGSIVAVKNVSVLPQLFHEIAVRYAESVSRRDSLAGCDVDGSQAGLKFWMVGDGKLRSSIEPLMTADPLIDVTFWGNVPAEHMPSVMNCIDVMVLPSLNEGLPLVCAEAIRCGASVIGSDVGGISEVIGPDFVVPPAPPVSHAPVSDSSATSGMDSVAQPVSDFVAEMASKAVSCLISPPEQPIPSSLDWSATARKELSVLKSL